MQKLKFKTKEWDYSFSSIDWWDRDAIRKARIMVVGCGALGNEVIKNLVLLNIGHITIVDFDKVEFKNLSRSIFYNREQAERNEYKTEAINQKVKEINPDVSVTAINGDIRYDVGLSYFSEADVIISCVDNRMARLFISRFSYLFGTPWIDGAIENISGSLKVYQKGRNCYECNLTSIEWNQIRAKLSCADVEHTYRDLGSIATTSISSSIIGALQVQEALKIVHEFEDKTMTHSLYYEGLSNSFLQLNGDINRDHCSCQYPDLFVESTDISIDNSVSKLYNYISNDLGELDATILLRNPLVLEYSTDNETVITGVFPKSQLKHLPGSEKIISKQEDKLEISAASFDNYKIKELGIADRDILKILCQDGSLKYLQLN